MNKIMEIIKNVNEIYGSTYGVKVQPTKVQQLNFENLYNRVYNKRKAKIRADRIRYLCTKLVGYELSDIEILDRLHLVTKDGVDTYYFNGQLLVVL